MDRCGTALAEGRRPDAERHAHTLKGVAGSLGAHQLQHEAGEVEAALRGGVVLPDLAAVLEPAERTLDALVAALVAALPPDAEATIPGTVIPTRSATRFNASKSCSRRMRWRPSTCSRRRRRCSRPRSAIAPTESAGW